MSFLLIGALPSHGDEPAGARSQSILYLNDGDFFSGNLKDSAQKNVVRWQSTFTTRPFEFNASVVRTAYFPPPEKRPAPSGDYRIELSGGDLLYGSLVALTKDELEINSSQFGPLKIARADVHRIEPMAAARIVYRGPNGLSEWTSDKKGPWREEAGRLVTDKRGTTIQTGIELPEQAHVEFEISWAKSPQFVLEFYPFDGLPGRREGFRFECWKSKLVLIRELEHDADIATVMELEPQADRIHLDGFYNASAGEFVVQGVDGRQLAKVTLPHEDPLKHVALTNLGAGVALEQLSVSRWNVRSPKQVDGNKPRVHKSDDTIVYGEVTGFDPRNKQFIVQTSGGENRIEASQVACIVQAGADKPSQASFRVGLHDGSRVSGELVKVDGAKVQLGRPGINQPLICPVGSMRSLVSLKRETRAGAFAKERVGRWESAGILSHGWLIGAPEAEDASSTCLVWKPQHSATASPLRSNLSGRIVYRDPPPPPKEGAENEERQNRQPRQAGVVWGAITQAFGASEMPLRQPQMAAGSGIICLVTGDRIPCESIAIDDDGVHFTSSTVTSDFVPHRSVKALEFVPKWTAAALAEAKRTRLLTLPRMQKPNPPTHLVSSTAGDFLRCRLTSMNADSLAIETRLEQKSIPRTRIACIIWLHDDEAAKQAPPAKVPAIGLQIQAVQSDGIRLTFAPEKCDGAVIEGKSHVLGACHVRLAAVDQLILGGKIKEAAEEQIYGAWKLRDAIQPEFARDGTDAAGTAAASESILLGKPAPDFELELLDAKRFKLSQQKGKVVVLHFWASWCGQCVQAMPEIEQLATEFKGRDIIFVDVNIQEDKATIASVLERMKIHPTVALDIDGAAAERFQVSAIPQIVVVDHASNVAELIIGANSGYLDQLRAAIQKSLDTKKPK